MTQREKQIKVANKLRMALGDRYIVEFDDCESCLTRVFYKAKNGQRILTKEVLNTEMKEELPITDFKLSREQTMYLVATNNL